MLYKRETLLVLWGTLRHVIPTVQPNNTYIELYSLDVATVREEPQSYEGAPQKSAKRHTY